MSTKFLSENLKERNNS